MTTFSKNLGGPWPLWPLPGYAYGDESPKYDIQYIYNTAVSHKYFLRNTQHKKLQGGQIHKI